MNSEHIEPESAEDEAYLEPVSPASTIPRSSFPKASNPAAMLNSIQLQDANGDPPASNSGGSVNLNGDDARQSVLMRIDDYEEPSNRNISPYSYTDETNNNNPDSNSELVSNNRHLHRRKSNPLYVANKRSSLPQKNSSSIFSLSCYLQLFTLSIAAAALFLAVLNHKQTAEYTLPARTDSLIVNNLKKEIAELQKSSRYLSDNLTSLVGHMDLFSDMVTNHSRISSRQFQAIDQMILRQASDTTNYVDTLKSTFNVFRANSTRRVDNLHNLQVNLSLDYRLLGIKFTKQNIDNIKLFATSAEYKKLKDSYDKFQQTYQTNRDAMQYKIDKVEKQTGPVGPRGPPGAGNFSLCDYDMATSKIPSSSHVHKAFLTLANDRVITGVYCSYKNYASAEYLNVEKSSSQTKHICSCFSPSSKDENICSIKVWHCPRTTP